MRGQPLRRSFRLGRRRRHRAVRGDARHAADDACNFSARLVVLDSFRKHDEGKDIEKSPRVVIVLRSLKVGSCETLKTLGRNTRDHASTRLWVRRSRLERTVQASMTNNTLALHCTPPAPCHRSQELRLSGQHAYRTNVQIQSDAGALLYGRDGARSHQSAPHRLPIR